MYVRRDGFVEPKLRVPDGALNITEGERGLTHVGLPDYLVCNHL